MMSIFDQGPATPCPASFNMAAYVLAAGAHVPNKPALEILQGDQTEIWTFAQIQQAIGGIATGLLQAGARPGARILLRLGDRPETPFAYLGAILVGLIPVPTSAQLTAAETAKIIDQLRPDIILHEDGIPCPDAPNIVALDHLKAWQKLPAARPDMGNPNRLGYLVYTSGTSGQARAVQHAHRAVWARRMMHEGWYGLTSRDRVLHAGAFNWTYTMGTGLMDPWSVGATALIPASGTPPSDLADIIVKSKASIFAAAPGVYRKILQRTSSLDAPALRHGLSAGEKLSPAILDAWRRTTGTEIHEAYGMSEVSTFISASPKTPAKPGRLGRPQLGRKIAILDSGGVPVPRGHPGAVAVHITDPGLMLGYLDGPPLQHPWFITGDTAILHEDDQVEYLGRRDDMMNAGGYRVSPLEVEAVLSIAPGITSCGVRDIEVRPDARVIIAFCTSNQKLNTNDLDAFMRAKLAAYKCPRDYIQVRQLPTGPNGKLSRKGLERLWRAK